MKNRFQTHFLLGAIGLAVLVQPHTVRAEPPPPDLLSPSQIQSKYLYGDTKDVVKARTLLFNWLEAKRQSEEYGDQHDSNYGAAVGIIVAGNGDQAADQFLEKELALTKSRRSQYAILRQMAERKERAGDDDGAIALWKRARESVMDGTHAYYTTRQALPLMSIAKLFLAKGKKEEAKDYYERYLSSDYGSKEANGVFIDLGNLYEEAGEWGKARALYEHYHRFPYYRNDEELQRRLTVPGTNVLLMAQTCIDGLRDGDRAKRRTSRNALFDLMMSSGNTDSWVRWLTQQLSEEPNTGAREEFVILRSLVTPLAEIGDHARRGRPSDRLKQMDEARKKYAAYDEVLATLFSRKSGNKYMDARALMLGGSYTLAGLSSTVDFRNTMETSYSNLRACLLNPKTELASEPPPRFDAKVASAGFLEILRENPSFRDFLKKCVSLHTQNSGPACLFLYALGFKEDIEFIIDHIPEDAYQRNMMMFGLAAALYRERTVDIPKVMGCDKEHVRDWWNVEISGKTVQQAFRDWWGVRKNDFAYSGVESAGQRVFGVDFVRRMTAIAPAPELDGAFLFVEGGFLDYSGAVYFFSFRTQECRPLIGDDRAGSQGIYASANAKWKQSGNRLGQLSGLRWDPQTMCCEFNISGDRRIGIVFSKDGNTVEAIQEIPSVKIPLIAPSLGLGIQRHGKFTYEIRRGDLFVVNEKTGGEACIESFGYILSFMLNQQGTKVLTIDREILGHSLNAYDIERTTPP